MKRHVAIVPCLLRSGLDCLHEQPSRQQDYNLESISYLSLLIFSSFSWSTTRSAAVLTTQATMVDAVPDADPDVELVQQRAEHESEFLMRIPETRA